MTRIRIKRTFDKLVGTRGHIVTLAAAIGLSVVAVGCGDDYDQSTSADSGAKKEPFVLGLAIAKSGVASRRSRSSPPFSSNSRPRMRSNPSRRSSSAGRRSARRCRSSSDRPLRPGRGNEVGSRRRLARLHDQPRASRGDDRRATGDRSRRPRRGVSTYQTRQDGLPNDEGPAAARPPVSKSVCADQADNWCDHRTRGVAMTPGGVEARLLRGPPGCRRPAAPPRRSPAQSRECPQSPRPRGLRQGTDRRGAGHALSWAVRRGPPKGAAARSG